MIRSDGWRRNWAVLGAAALVALGACDSVDRLLEAKNPAAINEEALNDEKLIDVLVASAYGEFSEMYDDPFIWRGTMFTDEQVTGINWEQTARLNQRIVQYNEGDADGMFTALSRARWMADSVSGRLRNLLDSPDTDARLATSLAFGGYSLTLMGEAMCEATINIGATIYSPRQLAELAMERFDEAIDIATAANDADVLNLARVGGARAALMAGEKAKVMAYAQSVPAGFVWWVEYSSTDSRENNVLYSRVTGGNHALGVHPRFLNGAFGTQNLVATQTDPRIQHTTRWSLGHNRLTQLYKPYQSLPFSGFNGEAIADGGKPILYEQGTDIALAFGIEAMHHYYEAAGPNGNGPMGSTLDFVNARRAFGNQAAVNLSGDALMAELREQRARDLFLGGWRLGDLRRYAAQGINDPDQVFPSGNHPNAQWGLYGDATCYPLPNTEYEGNPNIKKGG